MRIIVTNFGTTGDLRPMLALAVELRGRGHRIEMAFSPNHGDRIREHGFTFHPIGEDVSAQQRRVNLEWAANPETVDHYKILEPITRGLPQAFEELRAVCGGADLLVSGQAMPAARMVHELTGIPFVSVQFGHFGGSGTPEFQKASDELINPFRVSLGLPRLADPLTKDTNSPQLALHAISRHVLRRPKNWPGHFHVVGYFFLEEKVEQGFPELEAFFASGEKPVIITFGSMSDDDPEELTDLFLEAIDEVGCRVVIQQNWSALEP
ncbi:MAG: glycosyltransferase, partial [Acidobacteriota bacterium]